MNLQTIIYNNNLLYLAALENNLQLVDSLFSRGYPKSLRDIPSKFKDVGNEELNKVTSSYNNGTISLVKDLLKNSQQLPMLTHCLYHLVKNDKFKGIMKEFQTICGNAFYYGNLKAFELFCQVFGRDELCDNKSLLWYIHQVKRSKAISKKSKDEICSYVENLGLDWAKAEHTLVRWANMNRNLEDFQYFYHKRRDALKSHPQNDRIIRKELAKCIEAFLLWSVDVESNLQSPLLGYIATRKEFTRLNPYEGYWVILRKCYQLSKHFQIDYLAMETFFQTLLNKYPDLIFHLSKSKAKIPQLNSIIEKIKLKEKLSQELPISNKKATVQKV
jgi:hypothetical protein